MSLPLSQWALARTRGPAVLFRGFFASRPFCNLGMSAASRAWGRVLSPLFTMRVRVVKAPPARVLEGLDLRPYGLKVGQTSELPSVLADILIAWGYARPARATARPTKRPRSGRNK